MAAAVALAIAAAAASVRDARAQRAPPNARLVVIQLYNGINVVDLLGDGHRGQVVVSRREDPGVPARAYGTALFQVRAFADPSDTTSAVEWQIVPFFGPDQPIAGEDVFRSAAAGGCTIADLRVVRPGAGNPVQVVVARRTVGSSPTERTTVRFDVYELRANPARAVGTPNWFFQRTQTVRARDRWCDVNEALARELSLGTTGIDRRGEAPSVSPDAGPT